MLHESKTLWVFRIIFINCNNCNYYIIVIFPITFGLKSCTCYVIRITLPPVGLLCSNALSSANDNEWEGIVDVALIEEVCSCRRKGFTRDWL